MLAIVPSGLQVAVMPAWANWGRSMSEKIATNAKEIVDGLEEVRPIFETCGCLSCVFLRNYSEMIYQTLGAEVSE